MSLAWRVFDRDPVLDAPVNGGGGDLEVPHVGEGAWPDGAERGELVVPMVQRADVAARGPVAEGHAVSDSAREDGDLVLAHEQVPELGLDV